MLPQVLSNAPSPEGGGALPATAPGSTAELFALLEATCTYVVIWKPELFPAGYSTKKDGPIELLVENAAEAARCLGAKKQCSFRGRPLYRLTVGGKRFALLLRDPADGFFCPEWARALLAGRVKAEGGIRVLSPRDYFFTLAYRLVAYRVRIRSAELAYLCTLFRHLPPPKKPAGTKEQEADILHMLLAHMREHGYTFSSPSDASLARNPRLAAMLRAIRQLEAEAGLCGLSLLMANMHAWPNVLYFKAEYKNQPCFIKYFARCDEPPELEAAWTQRLFAALPGHFPEVLFNRNDKEYACIGIRFINGQNLRTALNRGDIDKSAVFAQLPTIALALRAAGCMHRDIWFDNFMVEEGRLVLIDFQYAVGLDPYVERPACLKYPYRIRALGMDTRVPALMWDDMAEFARMVETLGPEGAKPDDYRRALEFFTQNTGRAVLVFPRRRLVLAQMFLRKIFCSLLPVKAWRWRCRKW